MIVSFKDKINFLIKKRAFFYCAKISFFVLLASCGIYMPPTGEKYVKPKTEMPKSWLNFFSEEAKEENENKELSEFEKTEISWWKKFNDPDLENLIAIALEKNYDFRLAQSKVLEARANITSKTSDLFPKASAGVSGKRFNNFFNPIDPNHHPSVNFFTGGLDASWELDLFGGNYRARQAAVALHEASDDAKNYVLISLIAEVVRNYSEFRNAQNQLIYQKEIVASYDEILSLAKEKEKVGLLGAIDLSKVIIANYNHQSDLASLEAQESMALYNLEFLLGMKAGELKERLATPKIVPIIEKNLVIKAPLSLLRNRPDIRQAERELASSYALEGYAIAQIFPKISITGFLGYNNTKSGNLIKPQSKVFALGAQATQNFNIGGVIAGINIAKEQKKQSLITYEATVNKALNDVESSLVAFVNENKKLNLTQKIYENFDLISALNKLKFEQGIVSYSDFMLVKIDALKAQQKLSQNRNDFTTKTIAVYKALGGGWQAYSKK